MKLFILSIVLLFAGMQVSTAQETKAKDAFKKYVKINGRVQYDYEFLKRANDDDYTIGNEFRRVHLSAAGKIAPNIKYKVEVNFASGSLGFRDVYMQYTSKKIGNFAIGSMAEPTGLDMMTSSKYSPFFERAMVTSLQDFRWGSGFHYSNFKLLKGKLTFQMAITNKGINGEGFKDKHLEDGVNYVARVTSAPFNNKEKHQLVHIGLNFASRPYKELKFRAENHMGSKYNYVFEGADRRTEIGAEFGSTFGALSVQGEYKQQSYNVENLDYSMNSYYAMVSYFITGEHRPYKNTAFGRVKPKKDINNGGFGALELLARYSSMNASGDVVADTNNLALPSQINNISLGLNWYLTSHARFMYNFILTDDFNASEGKLTGHLVRFQIDF